MPMRPDQARRRDVAPLGAAKQHYWMVMRMADASGTDLVAAMREGRLTQAGWAEMVTRCRSCGSVKACQRWLDDPAAADETRAVPEGCPNRARMVALKTGEAQS